jgi:hypothetical protein
MQIESSFDGDPEWVLILHFTRVGG